MSFNDLKARVASAGLFLKGLPGSIVVFLSIVFFIDFALVITHTLISAWHWLPSAQLAEMFDLGLEENVPTWWSSLLWFLVALSCLACFESEREHGKGSWWWIFLACVFMVASVDEVATIHEVVGTALHKVFARRGLFDYFPEGAPDSPWIVFYAPFLLFCVISILWIAVRKFRGQRPLVLLVVLALECYALAICLDYFQGLPAKDHLPVARAFGLKPDGLEDVLIVVEETLENLGSSLLLTAFSLHAAAGQASAPKAD